MKYFLQFKLWTVDVSALTRIRQVCARQGHIPTNKFALIWVVRGDQEFLSVRVMVDGECSGTSHGFMMLITPRHERYYLLMLVTKKKTFKLLTSVRKGGLFTVLRVACVGRRVMNPSKKYTRRLASWPCDIRNCRN